MDTKRAGRAPSPARREPLAREPVEPIVQALARRRAARLHPPLPMAQARELQLVRELRRAHRAGQVLLVGEDHERGVAQLVLVEQPVQLVARGALAIEPAGAAA